MLTGKLLIWLGAALTLIGITLVTLAHTRGQLGEAFGGNRTPPEINSHPQCSDVGNTNTTSVEVGSLVGVTASSGEAELKAKGFVYVDGGESRQGKYSVWFNRRTRQCIQVIIVNARFDSVRDVQTHPKCN